MKQNESWPPSHFAVLQDGDGLPAYFRPKDADESIEEFADRIGGIVARGLEPSGPGTAFVDAIESSTGASDTVLSELILGAMAHQQALRQEARASIDLLGSIIPTTI